MSAAREVMTWPELGVASRLLAHEIYVSLYDPTIILGIARGGLLPAAALGYALGIKNTFTLSIEFYTGEDARLDVPMMLPPVPELVHLADERVLIVDDVNDTGATLEAVERFCAGRVASTRTAVLYEKPRSAVRCDHVWRHTERWITFPWSAEPPVGGGRGEQDG